MLDAIHWDTDLLRRYAQTGPRYVSYPSVEHFHSGIGSFELLHALRESRKARRPLSLYVHLPFCANSCYHCSRNRLVSKDRGRTSSYLQHLEKEIELLSCHLDPKQRVEQLHVGGGTPTFLNHGELRRLLATGLAAERLTALLRRRGVRMTGGLLVLLFGLWTLPGPHRAWLMGH